MKLYITALVLGASTAAAVKLNKDGMNQEIKARSDAFTASFNDILRRYAGNEPNAVIQKRTARCDSNPLNPCCDENGCEWASFCIDMCSINDPFGDAGCAAGCAVACPGDLVC